LSSISAAGRLRASWANRSKRCGDIDPVIIFYPMRHHDMPASQVETLLHRESGIRGLSGTGGNDSDGSRVRLLVIPTDEEAEIAWQTVKVHNDQRS
jgi:acetate kinase